MALQIATDFEYTVEGDGTAPESVSGTGNMAWVNATLQNDIGNNQLRINVSAGVHPVKTVGIRKRAINGKPAGKIYWNQTAFVANEVAPTTLEREAPDPNQLTWEGPLNVSSLVFTNGVCIIENRNFRSTDSTVHCMDLWRSDFDGKTVIVRNCNFWSAGRAINSIGAKFYLHVEGCFAWGDTPTTSDTGFVRRFVNVQEFRGLKIEHCYTIGMAGTLAHLNAWSGHPASNYEYIYFRYNKALNIDGTMANGARVHSQTLQVNGGQGGATPLGEIAWNQTINEEGKSDVEDNYNMYNFRGTSVNPIRIHHNYIRGAWYKNRMTTQYSGGGIILDSPNSTYLTCSAHFIIEYNIISGVRNYCIGLATANNTIIRHNKFIVSCEFEDGVRHPGWTSGIWAKKYYSGSDATRENLVENNTGGVEQIEGNRWDYENIPADDGTFPAVFRNNTSISGDITKAMEHALWDEWVQMKINNGVGCGPLVAS